MELNDTDPIPFGKYRGTPMQDVPAGYLHWLWTEAGYSKFGERRGKSGAIADYIERNMDALKKECPDKIWS